MKISLITTLRHNVGDDFVREGILYLVRKRWPDISFTARSIHKHSPITVREGFEWVRLGRASKYVSRILDCLPSFGEDKILGAELLIQAGAPVYWCHRGIHCATNEWFHPLITKRYLRCKERVPFLNLGAGSCQRYYSDGSEFSRCQSCKAYIPRIHRLAAVTTVRDALAKRILNSLGLDAPLLPCPSIFVADQFELQPAKPEYVCLNYMRGGGHYDFGQNIDVQRWEATFREFYARIARNHRCVFVCHNETEVKEARRIAPHAEVYYRRDYRDYLSFFARARCGVVNRMHAAFAIASFGRPSFVVGSDTRAHMVEQIGLRHAFVDEVDPQRLLAEFEFLCAGGNNYEQRVATIKQRAYVDYLEALEPVEELKGMPAA